MNERVRWGIRAGLIGLVSNVLLAGLKILIGWTSGALSILGDGLNNLLDAAASVVSMITMRFAGKPGDRSHPFGHARAEYLGSLLISMTILYVAFTVLREGVDRTFHPMAVEFSYLEILLLVLSVFVKIFLVFFYQKVGRSLDSNVLKAAASDAKSDVLATTGILIALWLSALIGVSLDGPFAIVVAILIGWNGVEVLRKNIDPLLGKLPDERFVQKLRSDILSYEGALGVHDMVVHDYGPGRRFVTVHVEVDGEVSAMVSHELVDRIERELSQKYELEMTIHMDPQEPENEHLRALRKQVIRIVKECDPRCSIHDFRVVSRSDGDNLLFDVLLPWELSDREESIREEIIARIQEWNPSVEVILTMDKDLSESHAK